LRCGVNNNGLKRLLAYTTTSTIAAVATTTNIATIIANSSIFILPVHHVVVGYGNKNFREGYILIN
jgi:hypothetical protein